MHASTTGTCRGQGRMQGGTEWSPLAGIAAAHMYIRSFRLRKRDKGFIPRGERPRAKGDAV